MVKLLGRWLEIYEDEIALFFWSTILLFLVRSSSILFDNFAETAFLKRFGVEYLPMIFMINSVSTFLVMGLITGLMRRLPGDRLLAYTLVGCGVSVAGLRLVVPMGFDILYPVLYLLKAQYEVLLALLFWNLANDLYNTRQSKRLFPLITAGGVMGAVLGSFGTPFLARTIFMDNLMWVYLVVTLAGAVVVKRMGVLFPTLLSSGEESKEGGAVFSLMGEMKKVVPLLKESDLMKILVLLVLLPNVVIPIINFQFNFAIDQQFATEGGMLKFFAYFRGALNIINFIILLFVGRIFGRWGLPVALMFHPFNYIIAFFAFLLRFDVYSAMYARMSTTILRTTINNPARSVLMGLFPLEHRSLIRPFLRGTVVRVGTLFGSGLILVLETLLHPRFLSLVAMVFVGGWIISTVALKKRYSQILLDLISSNMLDLKSLEERDVGHIFMDKKVHSHLVEAFLSSKGDTCLWYANLIKSLGVEDLDGLILSIIKGQDDRTKIGLLSLLSKGAGERAVQISEELADPKKPLLTIALLDAVARLLSELSVGFLERIFESFEDPEIRAHALMGLYPHRPDRYGSVIDSWLSSSNLAERRAGIISAGATMEEGYIATLEDRLQTEDDEEVISLLLNALNNLQTPEMNGIASLYLVHFSGRVRHAALGAFNVRDEESLRAVIPLLGDKSSDIRDLARDRLAESSYQNSELLIESLAEPNSRLRESIFSLLESLKIKDVDVFRFARSQLERAYRNVAESEALRIFRKSQARDLLVEHLLQKKKERVETVLRVLATQDRSGQMKIIWRGLSSSDSRQRSNAIEALETRIGHALSNVMIPLLEDLPPSHCVGVGRKNFQIPRFDSNSGILYTHLLSKHDWVTVLLTLYLIGEQAFDGLDKRVIENLLQSKNHLVQLMAHELANKKDSPLASKEAHMESEISIPDKILHLRSIQIFEGLSVSELAAIASVTEVVVYPKGTVVIKEGEAGEDMYMIIQGEVSVIKGKEGGPEIELDRIRPGDYFGEMALFEDEVRSATIRTEEKTSLLVLHKREFTEIVREYPQIALHICKELSQRIRRLHEKVKRYERK